MRFFFLIVCFSLSTFAQQQTKLADSLLNQAKKDTSYIQLNSINPVYFIKAKIDSINAINVQGIGISQDSVRRLFEANIVSAQALNYQKGAAEAYLKLGVNYYYLGNYKANFESQLEAIKIYESIGEDALAAKAYGQLGYSSRRRDLTMANALMQKAIRLAKQDSLKAQVQDIYNNYSILKLMEAKYDSAKYYVRKGLVIKEQLKDSLGIPYSYANLANAYVEEGNLDEALIYFTKALNLRKVINDSIGLGESYVQIAEVLNGQNKLDEALYNFKRSVYFANKKKYGNLLSYNYYQLSNIYKKTKKTDSALHYLELHLKLKDSLEGKEVLEELAALRVKFDTEKKEKQILSQRADLAEKELDLSKKNNYILGLAMLAAVVFLFGFLFYNNQKQKNRQLKQENALKDALQRIETQNKLQNQRLRISRDLHDNIGAQLTFIISSIDNLKYGIKLPAKLEEKLSNINAFAHNTIAELRDTIWAMNKSEITFEDLQIRVSNFIDKANLSSKNIAFSFKISEEINQKQVFTSVAGMNIYRVIQESINNAMKYSEATEISVDVSKKDDATIFSVNDNGNGFDEANIDIGNGLNNMRKRADEINAQFSLKSEIGQGTRVTLKL